MYDTLWYGTMYNLQCTMYQAVPGMVFFFKSFSNSNGWIQSGIQYCEYLRMYILIQVLFFTSYKYLCPWMQFRVNDPTYIRRYVRTDLLWVSNIFQCIFKIPIRTIARTIFVFPTNGNNKHKKKTFQIIIIKKSCGTVSDEPKTHNHCKSNIM